MKSVVFSEKASTEFYDAWLWYEMKQNGLGDRFENEVNLKIKEIIKFPTRFPNRNEYYREALTKTFPYIIVYYFKGNLLIIVSVFHASRNPLKKYR
ncbi:MAG: type II toxin-antitoxin system RelE/ParE family toxin [Ferruginibacter sp.]|nr:type II toxin-antitoxin system RelE/ParE family toxin [Ferruginibacter sp.]